MWNGYRRCEICEWRRRHIFSVDEDDTVAPSWACDSSNPAILRGLHQWPSEVWINILQTNRLCSPTRVSRRGRIWVAIPLRCEQEVQCSDGHYKYEGEWRSPYETVIGFHNTRLESLVLPTYGPNVVANGNGILRDGRLRYGCQTHDHNSGVNVYADGGLETFDTRRDWVQLEVRCTNTKRLRGGRKRRYCVRGPYGDICRKVALVTLWIPIDEVPSMVLLA